MLANQFAGRNFNGSSGIREVDTSRDSVLVGRESSVSDEEVVDPALVRLLERRDFTSKA